MLQEDPAGSVLLAGVPNEDLQRERQLLARVRLPLLHGPGLPDVQDVWAWKAGLGLTSTCSCMEGQAKQVWGPCSSLC